MSLLKKKITLVNVMKGEISYRAQDLGVSFIIVCHFNPLSP